LTLRELASLTGKLYSALPAIFLALLQIRALQQDLTRAQQNQLHYGQEISLLTSSHKGTKLVDKQHNISKKLSSETWKSRHDNLLGCFIGTGMGASLIGGTSTGGSWTKTGEGNETHKRTRIFSSRVSNKNFLKRTETKSIHLYFDNISPLLGPKRGHKESTSLSIIAKRV